MKTTGSPHAVTAAIIMATVALWAGPASADSLGPAPLLGIGGTKTIIVVVVVLLAAAGGAAYWFMNRNK